MAEIGILKLSVKKECTCTLLVLILNASLTFLTKSGHSDLETVQKQTTYTHIHEHIHANIHTHKHTHLEFYEKLMVTLYHHCQPGPHPAQPYQNWSILLLEWTVP